MTGGPIGGGVGGGGGQEPINTPTPDNILTLLECRDEALAAAADLEASAKAVEPTDAAAAAGLRTRASIEKARAAIYGVGAVVADALSAWFSTGDATTFTEESQ